MDSEYNTIRLIKSRTSIPIPEIYYWSTECKAIGAPFALMSFVEGRGLHNVWKPDGLPETDRLRILGDIAVHMAQLQTLSYSSIGNLKFDAEGKFGAVGQNIRLRAGWVAWERTMTEGPFDTYKEVLKHKLGNPAQIKTRGSGTIPLLKLIIDSIPPYLIPPSHNPISPWDFNYQNILINDGNEVSGFIDWDQVHTTTVAAGCGRYPAWITRDWDPAMYCYHPENPERHCEIEESPETLQAYRRCYAEAFAKASANTKGYDSRMTSQSHIVEALRIAINDNMSRAPILALFLKKMFGDAPPFSLPEYINDALDGDTSKKDELVLSALPKLWCNEWEDESGSWNSKGSHPETNPDDAEGTEVPHQVILMENDDHENEVQDSEFSFGSSLGNNHSSPNATHRLTLESDTSRTTRSFPSCSFEDDGTSTPTSNTSNTSKAANTIEVDVELSSQSTSQNILVDSDEDLFFIDNTCPNAEISHISVIEYNRRSESPKQDNHPAQLPTEPEEDTVPQAASETVGQPVLVPGGPADPSTMIWPASSPLTMNSEAKEKAGQELREKARRKIEEAGVAAATVAVTVPLRRSKRKQAKKILKRAITTLKQL